MTDGAAPEHDELVYESSGLPRTTNWWGAFVIGLAGTILVTGIAPVMVTELGAASIPVIIFITFTGYLVCLFLAELSAMMPDRSGGLPSYAYPAYKDRWPRFAEHVYGGPVYASCTCNAAGRKTLPYYFIGIATLLSYLLFYWWRKYIEDKRPEHASPAATPSTTVPAAPDGSGP